MKAKSKELLERAVAATVSSIEIYNKPTFLYREEAFAVLAINGWELLLKAKWLADHRNRMSCLYVHETKNKKDGSKGKRLVVKQTRSDNPFTHGLDFLAKKLVEEKQLNVTVWYNIQLLLEMRDSAIHFYNFNNDFAIRLHEIGAGSLKNFVVVAREWFGYDLSRYNFYLMPLSFFSLPKSDAVILNAEERNF
jgi:hypothetical protein